MSCKTLSRPPRAGATGDAEPPTRPSARCSPRRRAPADTPGAIAAGVPEFILHLMSGWMSPEEAHGFLAGLAT
jgi:hypothetical protein